MSRKVNEEFESMFNELLKLAEDLAKSKNQAGKKEKKDLQNFIATTNNPELLQEAINKLKNPKRLLIDSNQIVSVMTVIKDITPLIIQMLENKSEEIKRRRPAGSRQSVVLSTGEFTTEVEPWIVTKAKVMYKAANSNYVGVVGDFVRADNEIRGVVGSITDIPQLERMLEDLEYSKQVINKPEYAKSVDNIINQIINPRKNTLQENKENLDKTVQEADSSSVKEVRNHRGIFSGLKELFRNTKSTAVKDDVIDATVLETTDASEDLDEIDAADLMSGKGSLEIVGLQEEATGLKKLIQDFKAKNPERKAAAINGLNKIVQRLRKLLDKPSASEQFESLAVKLSNTKDGSSAHKKHIAQLAKLINSTDREELIKAEQQLGKLKFRANPISGVKNKEQFDSVATAIVKKIGDKLDGKVNEPEVITRSPRGSINLDELEERDFSSEELRNSGAFSDEEFSSFFDGPKQLTIFQSLKGLTARFKRTEQNVKNMPNKPQSAEDKDEIERIQREIDEGLKNGEATVNRLGDVMDPDNLLNAQVLVESARETEIASDKLGKSAESKRGLNTEGFKKFKKTLSDVSARISEKLFPFQKTLEKLAIQHAKAQGKKQTDIEKKIDKLIGSKDNLDITRVLHNLVVNNEDSRFKIIINKLQEKALASIESEASEVHAYSPDLKGLQNTVEDLAQESLDLGAEPLAESTEVQEQKPSIPKYAQEAREPARTAAEKRKEKASEDKLGLVKK